MRKNGKIKEWISIEKIEEKGFIKIQKDQYIKIIRVKPINFNLKTELEKQAILKSYHDFLKICNFDMQILIQSRKENLIQPISFIEKNMKKEKNKKIKEISKNYIRYIQELNQQKKSSSKNFFLIINESISDSQLNSSKEKKQQLEQFAISNLQEKYFKIKEGLSHCGNQVFECSKKESEEIIKSFLNKEENKPKKEKNEFI